MTELLGATDARSLEPGGRIRGAVSTTTPSRQDDRRCLYCCGNEPKTDEHVLQQAFETDLVLTDQVCDACNRRRFSPLDTKLVEYVRRLARHRELDTPPAALLNSGHPMCFVADHGTWVSFRVDANGNGTPFPQVVFSGPADGVEARREGTFIASHGADHRRLLGKFQAELSQPDRCSFKVRVVDQPSGQPAVQPALIRSARHAYVVRACTANEGEQIVSRLRRGRFSADVNFRPTVSRIDQPKTYGVVSVDLVPIWRALTKVALNAICHLAGPDVARLPRFDGARRFVLEGTGGEHFVQRLEEDEPERHILSRFAEAGDHVLILWVGVPTVVVLSLYGRPLAMMVLDPDESGCVVERPEDVSAAIVFNRSPRTHEYVRLRDDVIGFSRRFKMLPWHD